MYQFFGRFDRKDFLRKRFRQLANERSVSGEVFVDIPSGPGGLSSILKETGFDVRPFDLLPKMFNVEGLECRFADLTAGVPMEDESADYLICEEGIEHISDQLKLLREFNRVLKKGGTLFITTPNISCIRSKTSRFLNEHQYFRRLPLSKFDAVHYSEDAQTTYYGHLFLISLQKLHTLSIISGFKVKKVHSNKINWPSVVLGFTWPLIFLSNLESAVSEAFHKRKLGFRNTFKVYWEKAIMNISPSVLFCKHLIVELEKVESPEESIEKMFQKHETDIQHLFRKASENQ